jgi:hypothetical protein
MSSEGFGAFGLSTLVGAAGPLSLVLLSPGLQNPFNQLLFGQGHPAQAGC